MARPKKNRSAEYAAALIEELRTLLAQDMARLLRELERTQIRELARLHSELRALSRRLDHAAQRTPRVKVGRWVPGGPGRPPKDAAARIAAFTERRVTKRSRRRPVDPDTVGQ
jgi:hypothetical protein